MTIVKPADTAHPDFYRRYLFAHGRDELLINTAINAGIAWFMVRGLAVVPWWGKISFGIDTLVADGVHPNAEGHALICNLVQERLFHG